MPRIRAPKPETEKSHGGIDPLHPVKEIFRGDVTELRAWAREAAYMNRLYREMCRGLPASPLEPGSVGHRDPGPSVYLYTFGCTSEVIYIGITRNPLVRFRQHRRKKWWPRVTYSVIGTIDCRYHDGEVCSITEMDHAARSLESWYIDTIEPTENLTLGPVD